MHVVRLAASRTFCTAGSSSAMSTAMTAITTSNSISVNAGRLPHSILLRNMTRLPAGKKKGTTYPKSRAGDFGGSAKLLQNDAEPITALANVRAHAALGGDGVAGAQGLQDGAVLGHGLLHAHHVNRARPHAGEE